MMKFVILSILFLFPLLLFVDTGLVAGESPFTSGQASERNMSEPKLQQSFLTKIALYQQKIKQQMVSLIKQAQSANNLRPLILVLLIAFAYGVFHAAGPGHGKALAMSFIASRNPSLGSGLFFGTFTALFHGFSGVLCVLVLHYILQKSISASLDGISNITQIISFGLLALLGLGIFIKNIYTLYLSLKTTKGRLKAHVEEKKKGLLPWALAVGMVPCPGVVMVMLFCLSLGVTSLGLALAASISLGMATTISLFVLLVVSGKAGLFNIVPQGRIELIEHGLALLSGALIATLGTLFLLANLG
jgi:ABC-type nickel/cobalt efflux system permease component RcnA